MNLIPQRKHFRRAHIPDLADSMNEGTRYFGSLRLPSIKDLRNTRVSKAGNKYIGCS